MLCRDTKFVIMDYVYNRKAYNLKSIIKQYIKEGSIVFSDDAAMYTENKGVRSHLCKMGFVHYWINHTMEYVNPKYPFVKTSSIERNWCSLKRRLP